MLLTTVAVAVVAHAAIAGLPWAAAFALGAIVSPTDPLAATTIARRLGVPRNLTSVIEGESLVNDGTALVAYRTAVVAVGGTFDLLDATGDFVVNVAGGIAFGVACGLVLVQVFRRIVADDVVGVVLSLASGYIAYLPAEELGVSGVLAAVAVGLIVGRRSPELSTAASRLRGYAFWEVLVFLLNATLFVLVGLQLPAILSEQEHSAAELAGLGVLVSVGRDRDAARCGSSPSRTSSARSTAARRRWRAARAGACGWSSAGAGCAARSRSPPRWRCRATSPSAGC